MPEQIVDELREQMPLSDPKLNALREVTLAIMETHGWVEEQDIIDFTEINNSVETSEQIVETTLLDFIKNKAYKLSHIFQP